MGSLTGNMKQGGTRWWFFPAEVRVLESSQKRQSIGILAGGWRDWVIVQHKGGIWS